MNIYYYLFTTFVTVGVGCLMLFRPRVGLAPSLLIPTAFDTFREIAQFGNFHPIFPGLRLARYFHSLRRLPSKVIGRRVFFRSQFRLIQYLG